MHPIRVLLSSLTIICSAEPNFAVHSVSPTLSSAPSDVTGSRMLEKWYRDQTQSMSDAWGSYMDADPTKHAHAHAEMMDFAATATQWTSELPEWATATTGYPELVTDTPGWFSELPTDVQSIKLEEGNVWAAILAGKGYSEGAAPRETGRAALGLLAGVAVAAAVL